MQEVDPSTQEQKYVIDLASVDASVTYMRVELGSYFHRVDENLEQVPPVGMFLIPFNPAPLENQKEDAARRVASIVRDFVDVYKTTQPNRFLEAVQEVNGKRRVGVWYGRVSFIDELNSLRNRLEIISNPINNKK